MLHPLTLFRGQKILRYQANHYASFRIAYSGAEGYPGIQITLDTYSHVAPGLQEAAANRFDEVLNAKYNKRGKETVEKFG